MPHTYSSVSVLRDAGSDATDCARAVLDAYTSALRSRFDERRAFGEAVRVWRQHNPNASPEQGPPAVATIICNKL